MSGSGQADDPPACVHCAAGNVASFQPHSNEYVHRWAPTAGNNGRFTITLCVPKTQELRKAASEPT